MEVCKYVLVGDENYDNLRLSQILKQAYGKENIARFFEIQYVEPYIFSHQGAPIIICLDLFSFNLKEVTTAIGHIRDTYPTVVFNLYVDKDEYRRRSKELSMDWQHRFRHYFKTFKEGPDIEYEPIVRGSLQPSQNEAIYNITHEPIRLTPMFKKGLVEPEASTEKIPNMPTAFISYSRNDWQSFVAGLVSSLAKGSQKVWIDQNYILGGNDWMDAIGEALQVCDALLLVLSPDALNSRWVKLEYRYFVLQEKPIIPILYRQIAKMPFELAPLHYIDFTQSDQAKFYSTLIDILAQNRGTNRSKMIQPDRKDIIYPI
jgi:hypothetical protein